MNPDRDYEWLNDLQNEIREWSWENFGDAEEQPFRYPLIGAGEELGELTRSVLKRAQGIDDDAKYADRDDIGDEAERDAVGDIVIYMLDTANRVDDGMDVGSKFNERWRNGVDHDDPVLGIERMYTVLGLLTSPASTLEECDQSSAIAHMLHVVWQFCQTRGFDFKECVIDAWEEVSEREWDADTTA